MTSDVNRTGGQVERDIEQVILFIDFRNFIQFS